MCPPGGGVAQGVGEQVLDHLLDPIGIGDDLIRLFRHRHVHLDLAHPRLVLVPQHDVLKHPLDREQPRVERADAPLQPRQVQQVVDDAIEADGLTLDGVEVALAGLRIELEVGHVQRLEKAAQRRQRRLAARAKRPPASAAATGQPRAAPPRVLPDRGAPRRRPTRAHGSGCAPAPARPRSQSRATTSSDRDDGGRDHRFIIGVRTGPRTRPRSFHRRATVLPDPM